MMDVTHGLPASSAVAADDAFALALLATELALALEPLAAELAELLALPPQATSTKAITKAKTASAVFL